ncbi:phage tail spike protein, partial [Clostridium sp.]|uniref:phage tail spike protein n=1 Tax=Clostridium sp. TaxID=1506 RepID=UPI0032177BAC
MLQLYDLNKVKISNLTLYKDLKIQSVLNNGDKTLSFSYPSRSSDEIKEEGYIRTKTHEFVIKEISTNGDWKSIKAVLNVEDLEGKTWEHFDTPNQTITECLTLALAGTGWMIEYCNETKKRTIRKTNCSTWDIIQEIKKTYFVEMEFDTLNKRINIAKKLGNDKGVYFIDSLNLKDLDVKSNSYDFCTRLIAIGEDDLKVTVENYQYSSKKKTIIWKAEKYTDENSLREDAIVKLEELSKPYRSYGADIVDLASINEKYSILSYGLGDIITLISKEEGIKEKQRIVKMVEYPDEPDKNTCEIANTVLTFEDMQKEYEDTSKTVNNITSSNGTISEGAIKGTVEKITIKKADIESLNAVEIRVGDLEATSATITQLDVANANIANLQANKADIGELNAGVGRINILESSVGDIKTLVNGNLTSNNIQSLILSSDKVTVANGFIKNAMIENVDVGKILAGDISTNKFRIKSDNGGIEIVGATQQFKDKNNRVRIQMGQDTQGNFNFILRGEDGTTTLIDHNGIKEKAIADDLIKGNMISENAVGGKQIDYNSFTEEFNADTNTHALKSSKVLLDKDNQTLDVAFNSLSTKVDSAPPSITTESSINKLDGAIDGMLKLNSIKGKTLQNLFKLNTIIEGSDSIGYWYYRNIHPISDLSNKTVTVFNPTSREIQSSIRTLDNTFIEEIVIPAYSKKVVTLVSNRKIYTATGLKSKGWTEANKTELKAMVLEGDYTNKPIPDYFDGIRSVGESGENLEFISCGKNVFNGDMVFGSVKIEDGTVASNYVRMLTDFIRVKPNTSYKLSGYGSYTISWVTFYDVNKIYLGQVLNYGYKQGNSTLLIPNNAHYCRQCFQHSTTLVQSDLDYINNNFQIEEETVSTNHETYQEHRQLIPLTEQLRGFNGIMDIAKGGLVTKNIDKAVLDENRGWATYSLTTNETYVTFYTSLPSGLKNAPILCDTLPVDHSMYLGTKSMIASGTATGLGIFISLLKYSLTTPDINGFKAWLQANPVTVYFQLATPVETPIKVEQYMKQFKDGYFLTEGSLINPTIELEYSTSIASATSMMKEVTESNTTALNIQQGKIDSLISNTTIIKDGQSIQLKDAYNSTVATVNSINSVISTHTSKIDALTGQITDVETKTNEVIRDLDGVKTSVSSATITANSALSKATEAKQTADGFSQRVGNIETNYATTSAMNSAIAQSATGIKSEVSNTFVSKTDATLTYATKASMTLTENQLRLDFNSIDVTNLLRNSSFSNREISGWALSGVNLYDSNPSYFMPYDGWRAFSLATDRGLLYQSSMVKDRLPKRNTKYTFSLSSITESNIETFRLYIDYKLGSTYVGNQIVNLKAGYNVNRYSVTFTTKDIEYDTFLFYIEIKPKAGTTGYRVFSIG